MILGMEWLHVTEELLVFTSETRYHWVHVDKMPDIYMSLLVRVWGKHFEA